jgi:hypothetical protein
MYIHPLRMLQSYPSSRAQICKPIPLSHPTLRSDIVERLINLIISIRMSLQIAFEQFAIRYVLLPCVRKTTTEILGWIFSARGGILTTFHPPHMSRLCRTNREIYQSYFYR